MVVDLREEGSARRRDRKSGATHAELERDRVGAQNRDEVDVDLRCALDQSLLRCQVKKRRTTMSWTSGRPWPGNDVASEMWLSAGPNEPYGEEERSPATVSGIAPVVSRYVESRLCAIALLASAGS